MDIALCELCTGSPVALCAADYSYSYRRCHTLPSSVCLSPLMREAGHSTPHDRFPCNRTLVGDVQGRKAPLRCGRATEKGD